MREKFCFFRALLAWNTVIPRFVSLKVGVYLMLTAGTISGLSHAQNDCEYWNTPEYFKAATAQDVQRCLGSGASVVAKDGLGWSPLHVAAVFGTSDTIQVLLDAGASTEAQDENGSTPMHYVATSGTVEALLTLLAAGGNIEARTESGRATPLHMAAKKGRVKMVRALLDAGANGKARAANGKTPFDLARENENLRGTDVYWQLNDARFD